MKLTHVENCIEINQVLFRDVKDLLFLYKLPMISKSSCKNNLLSYALRKI